MAGPGAGEWRKGEVESWLHIREVHAPYTLFLFFLCVVSSSSRQQTHSHDLLGKQLKVEAEGRGLCFQDWNAHEPLKIGAWVIDVGSNMGGRATTNYKNCSNAFVLIFFLRIVINPCQI